MERVVNKLALLLCLTLVVLYGHSVSSAPVSKGLAAESTADQLIRKFLRSTETYNFSGTQVVTTRTGQSSTTVVTKVFHEKPNKYRWEFERLGDSGSRIIIDDGDSRWQFDENSNIVVQADSISDESSLIPWTKRLALLNQNYEMSLNGYESVAGRQAGIVTIYPKRLSKGQQDIPAVKLWIDVDTGLTLKMERYGNNGSPSSLEYFTGFNVPPNLDESLFSPKLAKGVKIVKMARQKPVRSLEELAEKVKLGAKYPEKLPLGFEFATGSFAKQDGRTIVVLKYTDGLSTLSIFQASPPTGQRTRFAQIDDNTRMYETSTNTADITIVGDVDQESLAKISQSAVGSSGEAILAKPKAVQGGLKNIWTFFGIEIGVAK